jgi:hypothetical protein
MTALGHWVAEYVILDPIHGSQVWARWTTEQPGRTGPSQLTSEVFRRSLARQLGWQVWYRAGSNPPPLQPLAGGQP